MDKKNVPQNTITRDIKYLAAPTTVKIMSALNAENREQIEISKFYERQPKPVLIAISEFENNELTYRRAGQENENTEENSAEGKSSK